MKSENKLVFLEQTSLHFISLIEFCLTHDAIL